MNKTKIGTLVTYGNSKFFVNTKTNETICEMDFFVNLSKLNAFSLIPENEFANIFADTIKYCNKVGINITYTVNGVGYLFTVKGNSKVSPADKYDKQIGEHIAETRAQHKAFNVAYKLISNIDKYLTDMYIIEINNALDNTFNAMYQASEHVTDLIYK